MRTIERIDLKNIGDLKSHTMNRVGNRPMHLMEFANGGTLELTLLIVGLNSTQIESFRGQTISLHRVENDLFVGAMLAISALIRKTAEQMLRGEHCLVLEDDARQLEAEAIALERQPA